MNRHHPTNNNIFNRLVEHAKQIEQHWKTIFQGIADASIDYPHLDRQRFEELNTKFQIALQRLHGDLESSILILATKSNECWHSNNLTDTFIRHLAGKYI